MFEDADIVNFRLSKTFVVTHGPGTQALRWLTYTIWQITVSQNVASLNDVRAGQPLNNKLYHIRPAGL
jgi:hypothetical protein